MQALESIKKRLEVLQARYPKQEDYYIPALWSNPQITTNESVVRVDPYKFFIGKIEEIKASESERQSSAIPFVYNMLLRYTTAFDHEGDGHLIRKFSRTGFRKNGTFLKGIALLPYIKSLGVNTVYLLPVTSIGIDGRKGTLGSPYAIKNPYLLDENLSEPLLETTVEEQFKAFVEAAHHLGMDVILEFVFRTASIDSDLALERPNWFYWIKKEVKDREQVKSDKNTYGAPDFTEEELLEIKEKVENGDFSELLPPHKYYSNLFILPPETVSLQNGKIIGFNNGKPISRIPSAFADWPPNDTQPPWSDVTYLRLYDHKDFNYIAYNTVRMYDEELAQEKYIVKDLWESICGIIPYYQRTFGIDGVLLDMGHSLPSKLRARITSEARILNKHFKFWEENFSLNEKSVEDGYDAVVGYLPFDAHIPQKLNDLLKRLASEGSPLPFFATAETHNTPRAASRAYGVKFSKFIWTFNCFLPEILFIHSGSELGESVPVNTGLGFTPEEQSKYPVEKLPLFSEAELCWSNKEQWTEYLRKIVDIRNQYLEIIENTSPNSIIPLQTSSDECVAFLRISADKTLVVLFAGSMKQEKAINLEISMNSEFAKFFNFISGKPFETEDGILKIPLEPFQAVCGELVQMNVSTPLMPANQL